jgi:hypothetical protein
MSNMANAQHRNHLIKLIEKQSRYLFALLVTILSAGLIYFGPVLLPGDKEIFLAVGTSLIASLVFALLYSSVVEKHHQAAVNEELERSVKRAVEEMKEAQQEYIKNLVDHTLAKIEEVEQSHYHQISTYFLHLLPTKSFPPTDKPGKEFNQTFELSSKSINMNSKATEQELLDFLSSIGADPAIVPQLRDEAKQFRQSFLSEFG